ncbi:putative chemoreceptor glutamine deamidase CheD [Synergistales bacterium]|nr:putative chemoreceptor glutamine deamidase CheD [Synergistales bacterium]GHV53057.1 putative chemoreceptor glutamine deamidase CheD [Synergistales bacterium]
MTQPVHVGMADMVVSKHPANLITLGLGSCIGLVIFDQTSKTAGMVHIMLPDSREAKDLPKPGKFADTAVPLLLEELAKLGANKSQLRAKMAGGAQMFSMPGKESAIFSVGNRNIEATKKMLAAAGIRIVAEDTGGNKGRSVEFSTDTLKFMVKTLGSGTKEL